VSNYHEVAWKITDDGRIKNYRILFKCIVKKKIAFLTTAST